MRLLQNRAPERRIPTGAMLRTNCGQSLVDFKNDTEEGEIVGSLA